MVAVGVAMTAVMQSSTAAVAVTLSAHYAGAVGLDQACALIIGQNIGTATSSALAAIGASSTAKRLALAYILFKLIAALIALVVFPVTTPLLVRASQAVDGVTLLAGYHTAYNVVGVLVLLPLIDRFTRLVERILPERSSPLTRCLDPSALAAPIAAEEAVRRTVARALAAICASVETMLQGAARGGSMRSGKGTAVLQQAADALRQAQIFLSEASGPPQSEDDQRRLMSTVHALDNASRLAEMASPEHDLSAVSSGSDDVRAAELCADVMRRANSIAAEIAALPGNARSKPSRTLPEAPGTDAAPDAPAGSTQESLDQLERCAKELGEVRRTHRSVTVSAVASGALTAGEAIVRVERVRSLDALAHHAWRSAAHLVGRGT
jgi:phosphate:Na+ symporter